MSRAIFKQYSQGQNLLFPPSFDDKIPSDSPVRIVNQIVDPLDIFRSCHLKEAIHQIFTQVVLLLVEMGYLSLEVLVKSRQEGC